MRYRRSIKICKGVRLNLSKSGMSVTTGIKGLSFTTGTNGTYVNVGIPGTGISTRKKISDSPSSHYSSSRSKPIGSFRVHMDDDGSVTISQNGYLITDASLIARIKRTDEFKAEKMRLDSIRKMDIAQRVAEYNQNIEEVIRICNKSEDVYSTSDIQSTLDSLTPDTYEKKEFGKTPPEKAEIRAKLEAEAQTACTSLAFWAVKKKRLQYVNTRLDQQYADAYNAWQLEKASFEEEENKIFKEKNREYLDAYERQRSRLRSILSGEREFVEQEIDAWLQEIVMPLDFSLQYDYDASRKSLCVDLDLPEIEDLPDETATQLSGGGLKMKKKTQSAIRGDYAQCVFGFAIFFASHFFNVSTAIEKILISGFTQRRNKEGSLEDDYIYSIVFNRSRFEHQALSSQDPAEFCLTFDNRCNLTKTNIFKTITPFSPEHILTSPADGPKACRPPVQIGG